MPIMAPTTDRHITTLSRVDSQSSSDTGNTNVTPPTPIMTNEPEAVGGFRAVVGEMIPSTTKRLIYSTRSTRSDSERPGLYAAALRETSPLPEDSDDSDDSDYSEDLACTMLRFPGVPVCPIRDDQQEDEDREDEEEGGNDEEEGAKDREDGAKDREDGAKDREDGAKEREDGTKDREDGAKDEDSDDNAMLFGQDQPTPSREPIAAIDPAASLLLALREPQKADEDNSDPDNSDPDHIDPDHIDPKNVDPEHVAALKTQQLALVDRDHTDTGSAILKEVQDKANIKFSSVDALRELLDHFLEHGELPMLGSQLKRGRSRPKKESLDSDAVETWYLALVDLAIVAHYTDNPLLGLLAQTKF
ncbi:hypothetical protein M011DRAFT_461382 [Sporormia fimetaria CBS 119925]|uniref:Uncharacterized protein n=1 Tax=Sporormia fimetaria CBS 119925 TaxID=1340428 RepID=A0A6A6V292_9PLEO|nr:hypothetical protein M011DRAFT_461382 [Sporormia fimetaria CBS 119925]